MCKGLWAARLLIFPHSYTSWSSKWWRSCLTRVRKPLTATIQAHLKYTSNRQLCFVTLYEFWRRHFGKYGNRKLLFWLETQSWKAGQLQVIRMESYCCAILELAICNREIHFSILPAGGSWQTGYVFWN